MSRIKKIVINKDLIDDYDLALDENGMYPGEAEAELDKFINSLEGRLAGFTTEQLQRELTRRMFEPYNTALQELKYKLDNMKAPF